MTGAKPDTVADEFELETRPGALVTPPVITVGDRLVGGYPGVDDLLSTLR